MPGAEQELVRIGELSRRVGISDHTLRAWEHRYGLLRPHRSEGGFRLYSKADEERVRLMTTLIARGLSSAQASRVVLGAQASAAYESSETRDVAADPDRGEPTDASAWPARPDDRPGGRAQLDDAPRNRGRGRRPDRLAGARSALAAELDRFEDSGAHAILDTLLAEFTIEVVLRDVVVPFLRDQGMRWQAGEIDLLQEHFASNVLRGRLAGLARGWASGSGPRAVVACPEGELHDLGAMVFGIVLHRCGWRVVYLGANTPIAQLPSTMTPLPALVVLTATDPSRFRAIADDLAAIARWSRLAIAGAGASRELADAAGALYLAGDPVSEAQALAHGDYAAPPGR